VTMIVETLAVGTELLLGQIVNTNAADIGERLAEAGMTHLHQTVVGDNLGRMVDAITLAISRSDALIITGGIGPTADDVTREAICAATGRTMAYSDEYAEDLRVRWERRGREMPASNLRQAEYPEGGELIANPKGSAPGVFLDHEDTMIFALPGVPAEMLPMIDTEVLPRLRAGVGDQGALVSRVIRTFGESESAVGELLSDIFEGSTNPTVAFLASSSEIKIRLTAHAVDEQAARALIAPVEAIVVERLGHRIFGYDEDTIERGLATRLLERGWTIGTAESATAGSISNRLTSQPGSSAWFRGGVVAYHEDIKVGLLGVSPLTIDEFGVVSEPVAIEMAVGARVTLGVDVAVSVTGSAGPDPLGQEVGTMIIGVATPDDARARTARWPGDRERIRTYTTTAALHMVRLAMDGVWWERS
jgi:competence/damage-inducible protein CinA-like protein